MKRSPAILFLFLFIFTIGHLPVSAQQMLAPGVDFSDLPDNFITSSSVPDLFTGMMKSSIPILVPAGRKGMEPKLALTYQSTQQNGWLGLGWDLDAGSIDRSTKYGVDYNNSDSYVLRMSGAAMELVNDNGTYRAKIENAFLRIKPYRDASGQPTYWEVTDKSGTTYLFGQTSDTRQDDPGDPTANIAADPNKVFKWCLDQVIDSNGNYIKYFYFKDQGQIYLDHIDYTGNDTLTPSNTVSFVRDGGTRPDALLMYRTSFGVKTTYRLERINVTANGNPVRSCKFHYSTSGVTSQSLLSSVQKVDKDGVSVLPDVTLQYSPESKDFSVSTKSSLGHLVELEKYRVGDYDGNGRSDILRIDLLNSGPGHDYMTVGRSTGSNFSTTLWGMTADDMYFLTVSSADFNGDGKTDVILFNKSAAASANLRVSLSSGGGFGDFTNWLTISPFEPSRMKIADFDGDGKNDVAYIRADGTVQVALSNGYSAFTAWNPFAIGDGDVSRYKIGDFDGNGKTDILFVGSDGGLHAALSMGTGFSAPSLWLTMSNLDQTRYGMGDFNGDGKADIVYVGTDGSLQVALSSGFGFTAASQWGAPMGSGNMTRYKYGDFDRNGKADVLFIDGAGNLLVELSTGFNFTSVSSWGTMGNGELSRYHMGDFNGDGRTDVAFIAGTYFFQDAGTPVVAAANGPADSSGAIGNLLVKISNGYGGSKSIAYKSSTQYSNTQLPYASQTVSSVMTDDGHDNISTTNYNYQGGYYDIAERDFRGFNYVKILGPGTNGEQAITETWFHQGNGAAPVCSTCPPCPPGAFCKPCYIRCSLPVTVNFDDPAATDNDPSGPVGYLKGKPYFTKVSDGAGHELLKTITSYSLVSAGSDSVYFYPPNEVRAHVCDNGVCGIKTKTLYGYDANGNVTSERWYHDIGDSAPYRTVNMIYSPMTDRFLGLPTIVSILDGSNAEVSKTTFYYDGTPHYDCSASSQNQTPTKGNVTRIVQTLDGINDPEARMAYDPYGNLKCTRDVNGNTSYIRTYDSTNTYPRITENALGQQTETRYYGVDNESTDKGLYGQVKSVIDRANSVTAVTKEYDAFGRPTKITDPYGASSPYGTATTQYLNFGTVGQQKVVTYVSVLSDASAGTCESGYTYNSSTGKCEASVTCSGGTYNSTTNSCVYCYPYCYRSRFSTICTTICNYPAPSCPSGGTLNGTTDKCEMQSYTWQEAYFDGFGRMFKTRSEGPNNKAVVTETKYDSRGAIAQASLPYFEGVETARWATNKYDPLGRVLQVTHPDTTTQKACYSPGVTVTIDADGRRKRETKDALGRLVTVEEYQVPSSECTTDAGSVYAATMYQYDVMGNLRYVTDALNNQTVMQYDKLGRKTFMHDPDMGDWYYTYYANGNLKTQTDAKKKMITFNYDALNRVTLKDYPDGTDISYTYDETWSTYAKGRLTTMSDASGASRYYYDKKGRPVNSTKTIDGTEYSTQSTYDGRGRIATITYPGGEAVSYSYDAGGNLSLVTGSGTTYANYSNFNALGQPGTLTNGNQVVTQYQYYTTNNRLSSIVSSNTATTLLKLAYGYSDAGNIMRIADSIVPNMTQTFQYDGLNRLQQAQSNSYGCNLPL